MNLCGAYAKQICSVPFSPNSGGHPGVLRLFRCADFLPLELDVGEAKQVDHGTLADELTERFEYHLKTEWTARNKKYISVLRWGGIFPYYVACFCCCSLSVLPWCFSSHQGIPKTFWMSFALWYLQIQSMSSPKVLTTRQSWTKDLSNDLTSTNSNLLSPWISVQTAMENSFCLYQKRVPVAPVCQIQNPIACSPDSHWLQIKKDSACIWPFRSVSYLHDA